MLNDVIQNAAGAALLLKASLAGWTALILLRLFDGRHSTKILTWLLAGGTTLLCIAAAWNYRSKVDIAGLTAAAALLSLFECWFALRAWSRQTPSDLHREEVGDARSPRRVKQSERAAARKSADGWRWQPAFWASVVGFSVCSAAVGIEVVDRHGAAQWRHWSAVAALVSAIMLGICFHVAMQLTFFCSPDSLNTGEGNSATKTDGRVHWSLIGRFATLAFLCAAAIACKILFAPVPEKAETLEALLPKLYAITYLLIAFIHWLVPHRVAGFQRKGNASGWGSLALASWIACLTLVAVNILPSQWPWRL